jgi:hypothetical protein
MTLMQPLQLGDQVRMIHNVHGLVKGSQGTVVRILANTDCYDVLFEHYPWPCLVHRNDLGRVERETAVGQA